MVWWMCINFLRYMFLFFYFKYLGLEVHIFYHCRHCTGNNQRSYNIRCSKRIFSSADERGEAGKNDRGSGDLKRAQGPTCVA